MKSALWAILGCFIAALLVQQGHCQAYASSSEHMKQLVDVSVDFEQDLREYFQKNEPSNKKLKQYVNELQMMNEFMMSSPNDFAGNLFDQYSLIRTLVFAPKVFDLTKLSFKKQALVDFYRNFTEKYSKKMPTTEDYVHSLAAVKRLVDLLEFDFDQLQNQITLFAGQYESSTYPSTFDYIELAKYFMNLKESHLAYAFANLALKNFQNNYTNVFVKQKDAYELLSDIAFYQDNLKKAIDYSNENLKRNSKDKQAYGDITAYMDLLAKMNMKYEDLEDKELIRAAPPTDPNNKAVQVRNKYQEMCRDQNDTFVPKGIFDCRYVGRSVYPISPFRAEQISKDPEIWMIYDTVTEDQARRLKDLTSPKMKHNTQFLQYMNAKNHVFEFNDDKVLQQVHTMIQAVTNLNLDSADELQVANYGIAGHYVPHFDFLGKENTRDDKRGDRLATFVTFLDVPKYGGETIFIDVGIKIKPVKLASLFWFNLNKRRQPDERTLNAACPVFSGHKWLASKWIREDKN